MPVLVLGLLAALGPLSIDLYLPAFPQLRADLGASDAMVQATLAGMTFGLALGQLCVGAWSDRVGRRLPLLLSTGLHVAATVACALAPSVTALAAFRVVQGIGAAGSAVLVFAIVRDLAEGRQLVRLLSRVTLVETVAPLVAPVAGAELLRLAGWRGIFGTLAVASAVLLVATAVLVPETSRPASRPAPLRSRWRAVRSDRAFCRATLVGSMTFAGVYAYVAASPLLLRDVYGLGARAYAVVFLLNSLGLVAGVQAGSVLAGGPRRHGRWRDAPWPPCCPPPRSCRCSSSAPGSPGCCRACGCSWPAAADASPARRRSPWTTRARRPARRPPSTGS